MENIFNKIIENYSAFTKSEAKAADYILRHKLDIRPMTISRLAQVCGVAEATLTRFCRTIGCGSFNEFKMAVAQAALPVSDARAGEDMYGDVHPGDSVEVKCQKLCGISVAAVQETLARMEPDCVRKAVDMLWNAKNVYCFGQGNSSIVAMDAWSRFSSITPKFHWISDSHMQATAATLLSEGDVVLYFSFSGATRELVETGELVRENNARLILVTRYAGSPGAALADLLLICGANESPLQQGSIAAKIAQLFIIDILFHEYGGRDPERMALSRDRTARAVRRKLVT